MKVLDLKSEKRLLIELVNKLIESSSSLDELVSNCFDAGVKNGEFFIDDFLCFDLSRELGLDQESTPLTERETKTYNGDKGAYLYDGLCVLDTFLFDSVSAINNALSSGEYWSLSRMEEELFSRLKNSGKIPEVAIKPISVNKAMEIINNFEGFSSDGCSTYHTHEKFSPSFMSYLKLNKGISFDRALVSHCFLHGLYCAKFNNSSEFISDILPIYRESIDLPITFNNGSELLNRIAHNKFVSLALKVNKPLFYSNEDYEKIQLEKKEYEVFKQSRKPKQQIDSKTIPEKLDSKIMVSPSVHIQQKILDVINSSLV